MSGWQLSGDAPTAYTRFAVPFMSSWTDGLIQAARCRHGDRVLDVACGTGTVANRIREVSGAECRITGLDVNEGMLNVARRNEAIDWHLASAVDMPFPDGSFDVVLCQQGLQYFPDRSAAVGEMARVLAPGGRLALNVWGAIEHNAAQHAVTEVVEVFFGADVAAPFRLAFTLNTREELRVLASGAGLTNIHVRLEHRTARHPDLAEWMAGFLQASPAAGPFLALPAVQRDAFMRAVTHKLRSYVDDDGAAVSQENRILTATKP